MGTALDGCKNCSTAEGHNLAHDMNEISSYYTNRIIQTQQIKSGLPYYPDITHLKLVNDLKIRGQQFQDMIHPSQHLHRNPSITWRRLKQVYPKQPFNRNAKNFDFQYQRKYAHNKKLTTNLDQALLILKNYPQLIQKIFPNFQISNQGFYIVYFCQGGNIHKRNSIVIDDFIPVDAEGKYVFNQPVQGSGVWMILLEKAWAKIMTSYHNLQHIPVEYFFSEMTGIPKQRLYSPGDFLMSAKHDFNPGESKYFKIFRDSPVQMIICIWQQIHPDLTQNLHQNDFIIEVIQQKLNPTKQYHLLPTTTQRLSNKLLCTNTSTNSMFQLPIGQNIIHIFNHSRSKRNCNIVIHSRKPVNAHARYQREFQQAKRAMIKNEYRKIYNTIGIQFQYPGIETKFCWIQHRGIFCIKNKSNQAKKIAMMIKKIFQSQIEFQDSTEKVKSVVLNSGQHGFFVVLRAENQEYGPFYQISVQKIT